MVQVFHPKHRFTMSQVGNRLNGIASHDESDLFELCKQVCSAMTGGARVFHTLLRLQVELPAGLKAHIEELEGERNEEE